MECDNFWEQVELEEYSISPCISPQRGITGIVVIDLDGLWTFIPE